MKELRRAIVAAVPSAEVSDEVGRTTSFEVTVDDALIHSKLATMAFPDVEEVVEIVGKVEAGGEPTKVTKMQSGGCNIL